MLFSFWMDKLNSLEYLILNFSWLHQISSQNFVLSLFPIFLHKFWSNQSLLPSGKHVFLRFCHHGKPWTGLVGYILLRALGTKRLSFSWSNLHLHLHNNATLNRPQSLIPSPPSIFGLHIFSQLTQTILLFNSAPPHKKFFMIWWKFWMTLVGALKRERK